MRAFARRLGCEFTPKGLITLRCVANVHIMHERIQALLRIGKLSARSASKLAGLDPTFISRLNAVRSTIPRTDALVALAGVFGTTADYLFASRGDPPSPEHVLASIEVARLAASEKGRAA